MVLWRVLVAVDVDDIAHGLEHEKGDAQWEDQLRQRQLHPCPVGQGQEEIGGEIPVFQHIQQAEIQETGDQHNSPATGLIPGGDRLSFFLRGRAAQVVVMS